ncbi:MAG: frataxin domain-containing protein [Rhodocyclaceae bacterium]|nr:frataxin domain-containing protein [Rhodocyclaceae bacterium]
MVINRHSVAQEIWVAARYEGHHFRHHPETDLWIDTKNGEELMALLTRFLD